MIEYIGKQPKNLSREEVRSVFNATEMLLRYHNLKPKNEVIKVYFTDRDLGFTKTGTKAIGIAIYNGSVIEINRPYIERRKNPFNAFVTTAVHEMIHIFIRFDKSECEKLTSTLTGKLKPDVVRLANILVENTYKRAGYIAHTKIAYKPKGDDHYDDSQYHKRHEPSNGIKYRKIPEVVV